MSVRTSSSDILRISVSSATSTSSHGSTQDDPYNLGVVYVWGDVICDKETRPSTEKYNIPFASRTDVLLPRPLESNITSDLRYLSCGVRHSALVTSQGELFTWGEESGGCLGQGVGKDIIQPRLVESSVISNVDYVSCGEFHTCVVTASGELFTWGDGTHNVGLLGHGSNISHWVPKRVSGPLESLHVSYVACGTWHTALVTLSGQLFTFGDGAFGVLGHGDRESVLYPREVESLMGLKTITVACGVWHTAAIVEVIVTQSNSSASTGKLFTWGDGDKYRLGHGDKEPQLKPTCVPSLIDHNFQKLACGHSLTVGLTISGQVFTMGSTLYGQLGNPFADGKFPCLVKDKLAGVSIEEITCGAYHVAVLSTKNEVYTWGRGANGRLGHGDIEDRKVPTLVEALKDKQVKNVTCGSNFSAAICRHKLVSGSDQTHCSSCRQAFGFTRKRHNCYNCGLIHCHSCSSRKVLRAALSTNNTKPYRVCDSCYQNLSKSAEQSSVNNKKTSAPRLSAESRDFIKPLDSKSARSGKKTESLPLVQGTDNPSYLYLKDLTLPTKKVYEKYVDDNLIKTNELLNQELKKLRPQVDSLKERCQIQEFEMQKMEKKAQEAITLATEEFTKSRAAKEVIKSLTLQLKDMAERLPSGVYDSDDMRPVYPPMIIQPHSNHHFNSYEVDSSIGSYIPSHKHSTLINARETVISDGSSLPLENLTTSFANGNENESLMDQHTNGGASSSITDGADDKELASSHSENVSNARSAMVVGNCHVRTEWTENYEHGVDITLVSLQDGTRDLKKVRFSPSCFGQHQPESWWSMNREKIYENYNIRPSDKTSASEAATQPTCTSEEEILQSVQPQ